ncbi:MAG: hypothetical protein JRI71_08440 [Deltaproteobacteria bacterium]|nr:hypothetical protein [Deltaproteobacteria bacterium]MBW2077563.1 hypothetical protein [Deltaproteobacteria bacterium]MBW2309923.1 hypothetical protein [Deltaproteobacteria bacterium]
MDTPETLQSAGSRSKTSEIGDNNTMIVAYNHVFDIAPSSDEDGYLLVDVPGYLC